MQPVAEQGDRKMKVNGDEAVVHGGLEIGR